MTKTTAITVRLDPQVKKDAQAVLNELGLTTTQAVSLFFKQISLNKGLPFAVEIPNEETIQAIEDGVNRRNIKTFENAEAALDYLGLKSCARLPSQHDLRRTSNAQKSAVVI